MDERLRSVEREAAGGDPAARARLLAHRLRAGVLDPRRIQLAAHFGLAEAELLAAEEVGGLPCPCLLSKRHGGEPPLTCYLCHGTGARAAPRDLIQAVTALAEEIGDDVLTRWANEAMERVRSKLDQDSQITPQFTTPFVSGRATRAVTWAYRVSGNSAVERAWQRRRLGELIVGL